MTNKQVIKAAHGVVFGLIALAAVIVAAQQAVSGQNANSSNSAGMSGRSNTGSGQNSGGAMLGSSDRKFVMEAAMGGMTEVELGRLAAERGSSEAVKSFGQRMVDDHTRANTELTALASRLGVTLPTALDAKHAAVVAKFSRLSGAEFDRAYAKDMVKDHEKDVALFEREAARGAQADLKSFASSTLPTLREHLSMARALPSGGNMTHK
jgi:putative membrane protein